MPGFVVLFFRFLFIVVILVAAHQSAFVVLLLLLSLPNCAIVFVFVWFPPKDNYILLRCLDISWLLVNNGRDNAKAMFVYLHRHTMRNGDISAQGKDAFIRQPASHPSNQPTIHPSLAAENWGVVMVWLYGTQCPSARLSVFPGFLFKSPFIHSSSVFTEMTINIISNQYNDDKFSRFALLNVQRMLVRKSCTTPRTWPEWRKNNKNSNNNRTIDGHFVSCRWTEKMIL